MQEGIKYLKRLGIKKKRGLFKLSLEEKLKLEYLQKKRLENKKKYNLE